MWILIALLSFYVLWLCAWRMRGEDAKTFGSARWCPAWPLFRKGHFKAKGLMAGDWTGLLPIYYDQTHAITFGATGAGKGTAAVVPNLLSCKWIFLLDPGGENSAIAAKHWREAGYEFGCINFFGMHTGEPWALPQQGFNPLDLLNPQSFTFAADALVLAQMLIKRSGSEGASSEFFKNTACAHLRDFIIHCKTAEPPERQNLTTVYGYIHSDAPEWEALLDAMKRNPACGHIARTGAIALERREAQAPEEFSGVLSTMQEHMNWLADPLVREFLARSDVDFEMLKGRKVCQRGGVISLVLPLEYNKTHAAISRLALACAVLTLQREPRPKGKVLFLIDEAADLGKIEGLADWLATLRKYGVVIWPIFQNIGQLAQLYGRGWQTLVANCGMLQILGIGNDLETAQYTERLLGQCTVQTVSVNAKGERSFGQTGRALITADELRRLKSDQQIVLIGNLPPIRLGKTPYWKRPALSGRFHPNPYIPGKPRLGVCALLKSLWGWLYYAHVWLMAPHPIAAILIAIPLTVYVGIPLAGFLIEAGTAFIEGATR